MRQSIVLIVSRGEVIRNFVYSGISKYLMDHYELTIISVIPNESVKSIVRQNCDNLIELEQLELSYIQRLLHEIIDLAHNKYLWSEAAKVRWYTRDFEAKTIKQKIIRFFKKSIATMFATNNSLEFLEQLDLRLSKRNKQVKKFRQYYRIINPVLVFNGSHSHSKVAFNAIQAASIDRIKTVAFLFSWDNLTSQGRVFPPQNYYFSWNSAIKKDFHRIYPSYDDKAVIVTGTPQFIGHFNSGQVVSKSFLWKTLGLKSNEKYFLYSSSMSNHVPFETLIVSRIADMIANLDSGYRLVVRTYAKDRQDVFEQLKRDRPDIIIPEVNWEKNFQTPLLEDQDFFTALLKNCIAGINVASTITLELCMLDKLVINVGYNPPGKNIAPKDYFRFYSFDHYKPIVESGAIFLARNETEMLNYLKIAINNPNILKEQRRNLIDNFFDLDPNLPINDQLGISPKIKILEAIEKIIEN